MGDSSDPASLVGAIATALGAWAGRHRAATALVAAVLVLGFLSSLIALVLVLSGAVR